MISGKNIKNKSIAGKKLKNRTITARKVNKNTLTGTEINESRLDTVPDASRLSGVGIGDFLTTTTTAGGDLAGTYPSPSIRTGSVTPRTFGTIPAARAFHSTTQSIPDDTLTSVALDGEAFDTASVHSTTENTSRLTAPVPG